MLDEERSLAFHTGIEVIQEGVIDDPNDGLLLVNDP
jgi:hypothetical protein